MAHQMCVCCCFSSHSYWHPYLCFRKPLWLYWPTHGVLDSFHFKILTPLQSVNCHKVYILTGYENWSFLPQNGQRLSNSMNGKGYGVRPVCFIQSEGSYRARNSEHTWSGNLEECKYLNLNVQDGKQSWQQYQCKALGLDLEIAEDRGIQRPFLSCSWEQLTCIYSLSKRNVTKRPIHSLKVKLSFLISLCI